jgi:hypothetical protein
MTSKGPRHLNNQNAAELKLKLEQDQQMLRDFQASQKSGHNPSQRNSQQEFMKNWDSRFDHRPEEQVDMRTLEEKQVNGLDDWERTALRGQAANFSDGE